MFSRARIFVDYLVSITKSRSKAAFWITPKVAGALVGLAIHVSGFNFKLLNSEITAQFINSLIMSRIIKMKQALIKLLLA